MLFKFSQAFPAYVLCLTAFTFSPQVDAKVKNAKSVLNVHKCSKLDTKENLLACAMYAESRNQGKKGMTAVGNVVLNRVNNPSFPKTIRGVLYQQGQFSYTYQGAFKAEDQQSWVEAKQIASQLIYLNQNFPEARDAIDITQGATYFKKRTTHAFWAKDMKLVFRYKGHQFFRED